GKIAPFGDGIDLGELPPGPVAGRSPRKARKAWEPRGPRRGTIGRLTADTNRLRPAVLPRGEFERHHLAGLQQPHPAAFDVAVVDEEVTVHRFALDEAPAVLEPRHNAGIAGTCVHVEALRPSVPRLLAHLDAQVGAQGPEHRFDPIQLGSHVQLLQRLSAGRKATPIARNLRRRVRVGSGYAELPGLFNST